MSDLNLYDESILVMPDPSGYQLLSSSGSHNVILSACRKETKYMGTTYKKLNVAVIKRIYKKTSIL